MPTDELGNTTLERAPYFFADKNSVDQTGIVLGVWTKVTFPNVLINYGGYWDGALSRLVPPIGPWLILCNATVLSTNVTDQMGVSFAMLRNGDTADVADRGSTMITAAATNSFTASFAVPIISTGTDYWEAWLQLSSGAGNKTIWGVPVYTFIHGISETF